MQKKTRVLVITYYWPPSGGAGVQRWLKFVKYLVELGLEPVVYTVENGEYPIEDLGLFKDVPEGLEVIKTPIWEPYNLYKKLIGQKKDEKVNPGFISEKKKPSKVMDFAVWLRGNFFIPDARMFWIKPSIKYLKDYLVENPVDVVVSSGPPHSTHLIAQGVKKQFDIPWIADFRDPWTNIDFYKDLKLTSLADKKHRRLEKKVLKNADRVVTVGPSWAKEFEDLGASEVKVITNGYDAQDYEQHAVELDEKLSIVHIGSMNKDRNPINLWSYLSERVKKDEDFAKILEIKLIGKVDVSIMESLDQKGLLSFTRKIDYMPHKEVINEQRKSKVLLLVVNDTPNAMGVLPGKLFEYMAAERPILVIGPKKGDAANVIDGQFGEVFEHDESDFDTFFEKDFTSKLYAGNPKDFERRELTKKMIEVIKEIT